MLLDNWNILTGGERSYVWDQQNRLKEVTKDGTTVRFTYRSDGLRARKEVVGGLTIDYVYDGQTVIGETRSDGTSSWYTPGANGYISRTDLDSVGNVTNKEWFVYDGLGSCRAMVKPNAAGTDAIIVARYDYDVYGKVRTQSGSSSNKFKYVANIGHPTDEESGLIYMRARYYDTGAGRFVSEDPGQHDDDWYVYAKANPVVYLDENGRWASLAEVLNSIATSLRNNYGTVNQAALELLAELGKIINATKNVKGTMNLLFHGGAGHFLEVLEANNIKWLIVVMGGKPTAMNVIKMKEVVYAAYNLLLEKGPEIIQWLE